MSEAVYCPECRASLSDHQSCRDYFHQMCFWELENLAVYGVNHHLMVLCYHLQHPSLYSQPGLLGAMRILAEFIERGVTPQDMRRRLSRQVDSRSRNYKISGTLANHGKYLHPVKWEMTAADVVAGGIHNFVDNVSVWAHSVYRSLKTSGNLPNYASPRIYPGKTP